MIGRHMLMYIKKEVSQNKCTMFLETSYTIQNHEIGCTLLHYFFFEQHAFFVAFFFVAFFFVAITFTPFPS